MVKDHQTNMGMTLRFLWTVKSGISTDVQENPTGTQGESEGLMSQTQPANPLGGNQQEQCLAPRYPSRSRRPPEEFEI